MAEEYHRKVRTITQHGSIAIGLALSKDVGILSTLLNADKPLISKDIADQNQLKERYVHELLGCLVSAELIRLSSNNSGENTYHMSDEQKEGLNMDFTSPAISMISAMAEIYEKLKTCFPLAGPYGFLYEEKAQDAVAEYSSVLNKTRIAAIFEFVPELQQKLEAGIDVIEFGCGMGSAIAGLAQQFPNSRFTATELMPELVTTLKTHWSNIPNMSFDLLDLCNIDKSPNKVFDWAFAFDVIHDLPHSQEAFHGIRRILKQSDGLFTHVDISPTENGTHAEGVGDEFVAQMYARGTFLCVRESFKDDTSKVLGACGGRTVLQGMARKAGFECSYKTVNQLHTLFTCRIK